MKTLERKENPRKTELINRSVQMRKMRQDGMDNAKTEEEFLMWSDLTINAMIMDLYEQQAGTRNFKTFNDWKAAGMMVKKGEKGWIIWGQKRTANKTVEVENVTTGAKEDATEEFEYWPVCYLFTEQQVEAIKKSVSAMEEVAC